MLKDVSYSVLKEDERAYKIMLLKDQDGYNFSDIAKEFDLSLARVTQIYRRLKIRQIRLYINHTSVALGYDSVSRVEKIYNDAADFYRDYSYECAYLENEYKEILAEYRAGEPGMPEQFVKSMPPFKRELGEKAISRIIEMREKENETFDDIAKKMHITRTKAKYTYDSYYHARVLCLARQLADKTDDSKKKAAIFDYCFKNNFSPKKRYEMLIKK